MDSNGLFLSCYPFLLGDVVAVPQYYNLLDNKNSDFQFSAVVPIVIANSKAKTSKNSELHFLS